MLDVLERFCVGRGYGFLRLDGSTPSSKRQAVVERFNSKHGTEGEQVLQPITPLLAALYYRVTFINYVFSCVPVEF